MYIGKKELDVEHKCHIMGILNVTPDSFSDGGKWTGIDRALAHAGQMIADGAEIIDVGGESTRPGYRVISNEEEIARVVPVIEAIKENYDILVSIDTYKGTVAEASLTAGADMVNDIWGFRQDPLMAEIVAAHGAACCLTHNRKKSAYDDFPADLLEDMLESVRIARNAGVEENQIILDPGIGFAKTLEQNLQIMNHLEELHVLGYPVLLGASRKSMIGLTLNLPVDQRLEGTLATTVLGVMKGCAFVRVHDVKENKRVIDMTEAILAG